MKNKGILMKKIIKNKKALFLILLVPCLLYKSFVKSLRPESIQKSRIQNAIEAYEGEKNLEKAEQIIKKTNTHLRSEKMKDLLESRVQPERKKRIKTPLEIIKGHQDKKSENFYQEIQKIQKYIPKKYAKSYKEEIKTLQESIEKHLEEDIKNYENENDKNKLLQLEQKLQKKLSNTLWQNNIEEKIEKLRNKKNQKVKEHLIKESPLINQKEKIEILIAKLSVEEKLENNAIKLSIEIDKELKKINNEERRKKYTESINKEKNRIIKKHFIKEYKKAKNIEDLLKLDKRLTKFIKKYDDSLDEDNAFELDRITLQVTKDLIGGITEPGDTAFDPDKKRPGVVDKINSITKNINKIIFKQNYEDVTTTEDFDSQNRILPMKKKEIVNNIIKELEGIIKETEVFAKLMLLNHPITILRNVLIDISGLAKRSFLNKKITKEKQVEFLNMVNKEMEYFDSDKYKNYSESSTGFITSSSVYYPNIKNIKQLIKDFKEIFIPHLKYILQDEETPDIESKNKKEYKKFEIIK